MRQSVSEVPPPPDMRRIGGWQLCMGGEDRTFQTEGLG